MTADTQNELPQPTRSNADFWKVANSKLIRYGGQWSPVRIVRAKGTVMWDESGKRVLDWTSGQMSSVLGHGHPEIVEVVDKYMRNLDHLFSGMISDPVVDLAEALTNLLPPQLNKCMFLSTGSETNECALKLAKMYTGGHEIGTHSATNIGFTPAPGAATFSVGRKGYGPQLPGNLILPVPYAYRSPFRHPDGSYDWRTELDYGWDLIDRQSTGALAAVMIEPIVSAGGIITLPEGYLKALKEHCEKRGMLLIVDEAQTGMGRTGNVFAFEHEGVVPDILTLSKTLGAGLPLGATVVTDEVERVCNERGFFYYTTHQNDPLVAAVGAKVCEIVKRDRMDKQAAEKGELLKQGLLGLQKKYPCIGDVRGRGLMMGIEVVLPDNKPADELGTRVSARCMELGLSCNVVQLKGMGGTFRIAPPLTVTPEEIAEGIAIMDRAFAEVLAQNGA
jgi:4-aminobutyrate aminotransferase-like enzyme